MGRTIAPNDNYVKDKIVAVDKKDWRGVLLTRTAADTNVAAMGIHDTLIADIEAFLLRHGMNQTQFGIASLGNPHILRRLRDGHGLSTTRADKLYSWMREYDRGNGRRRKANHPSLVA